MDVATRCSFSADFVSFARNLRSASASPLLLLEEHIIACPLACDTAPIGQWSERVNQEMMTRVRATENEVFIAVVNHAGRFNGGSFVVGPRGEILHQMGKDAAVAFVDVPVGIVPAQLHSSPLGWMGWGYRRAEVYRPYLN